MKATIGLFLVLTSILELALSEFTAQDCLDLGFQKATVLCSTCKKLDDYGLEEIKPFCLECCVKDDTPSVTKKYPNAVLEVCTCKFGAYPQIQAFIKSDRPKKYPNLQIKYVRGLDPIVKMIDFDGEVKETLSINKWNTDTVDEFFATHLVSITKNDDVDDDKDYLMTNEV